MAASHYIRIRGHVSGPFPEDKLIALVKRGQLNRSHEVSEDGANWVPAGQIEALFGKPKRNEDGGSDTAASNSEPVSARSESVPPAATSDQEKWFYAVNNRKLGPVSWKSLQEGVSKGKIPLFALVWSEGMADWQEATTLPGLVSSIGGTTQSQPVKLTWGELLPAFRIWNDGSWMLPWVQCLAVALLFPLLALEYQGKEHFSLFWVAITFLFYFTLLWTAFFHWCISPDRVNPWRLIGVWLFTATLGMLGVLIASFITQSFFIDALAESSSASLFKRLVGWTIAVGLVEECGKLLAVLLLTRNLVVDRLPRTCAFVGIVSGLSFGTIEAAAYTSGYVQQHQESTGTSDEAYGMLFFLLMLRWICLPLLHAIWAGISGYFVGLSYKARRQQWTWILRGLLIAAVLHGIYDVGASDETYSWLTVLSAAASLSLLIGYLRSEDRLSAIAERYHLNSPAS